MGRDVTGLPAAATGQWRYRGDRMDLALAVDVMIQQTRRVKVVRAGTSTAKS